LVSDAENCAPVKCRSASLSKKRKRCKSSNAKGSTEGDLKRGAKKSKQSVSNFDFRFCLLGSPELVQAQEYNLKMLESCVHKLPKFDFWSTLDDYNQSVKNPLKPGHEFFVKEMGPILSSKAKFAQSCHGCSRLIDEGEYFFWNCREFFHVDAHFCQVCVAYIVYHLEIRHAVPDEPLDVKEQLEAVLRSKFPQLFAVRQ